MPSRYESFSYALIEGLESGLPVLVGTGACLTSYFDDEQRRTMGQAARASASEFSWQRVSDRTLELYESVCSDFNPDFNHGFNHDFNHGYG